MKTIFTLALLFSIVTISHAQWVQTKGPCAGRTTAMITVGNNIYAAHRDYGGTDGRVYRSSDLGQTWIGADAGINPEFSIFSQFANIGETIIGAANWLYRTTNQGSSWEIKDAGIPTVPLSVEAKGNDFFCGTGGAGVYISQNLGETWEARNNGLTGTTIVYDIEQLGNYLYLAIEGGGGPAPLYRSSNNGLSWQIANTGLPLGTNPHKFTVNGGTIFVSTEGDFSQYEYGLYKSVDSGNTWTPSNNGLPQILYGNTGEIFSHNGNVYVSTTYPGVLPRIFKSTDNGASFFEASNGLRNGNQVLAYTVAGNYLFSGSGNYSGVFRSADEGASWTEARKGLANSRVYALMDHNGRLYAGAQEGLFYTTDMGENWTEMQNGLPYGTPTVTMEKNGSNIYLGTDQYGVFRSIDNGNSWAQINNGLTSTFAEHIEDLLIYNGAFYAATWDGIYKSVNNGDTWTLSSTGLPAAFGGGVVTVNTIIESNGVLFAGTVLEGIYKSTDGGLTWTDAGNGLSTSSGTVNCLYKYGTDIFAATESGVYKSSDQGASWQLNPILYGGPFKTLTAGNGVMYASQHGPTVLTGYGVFRSLDNGATWETYNEGMREDARLMSLLVYNNVLFGATDTRSVWGRPVAGPVPVNLVDFTGRSFDTYNELRWTTASEQNNKGFEIQRSFDGINFGTIAFEGSQAINGISSSVRSYRYLDTNVPGNAWYRLRQLDFDNNISLSDIVFIKNSNATFAISVLYPNPVANTLQIDVFSPKAQDVLIQVFDITGKLVQTKKTTIAIGKNIIQWPVKELLPGTYFFGIINQLGEKFNGRFLKR